MGFYLYRLKSNKFILTSFWFLFSIHFSNSSFGKFLFSFLSPRLWFVDFFDLKIRSFNFWWEDLQFHSSHSPSAVEQYNFHWLCLLCLGMIYTHTTNSHTLDSSLMHIYCDRSLYSLVSHNCTISLFLILSTSNVEQYNFHWLCLLCLDNSRWRDNPGTTFSLFLFLFLSSIPFWLHPLRNHLYSLYESNIGVSSFLYVDVCTTSFLLSNWSHQPLLSLLTTRWQSSFKMFHQGPSALHNSYYISSC